MCTLIVDGKPVCIAYPGETLDSVITNRKKKARLTSTKKITSATPEAALYPKKGDEETLSFSHQSGEHESMRIPYNDGKVYTCRYRNGSHRNSGRKPRRIFNARNSVHQFILA